MFCQKPNRLERILSMRQLLLLIILINSFQISYSFGIEKKGKKVEITYVANEGFIIQVGSKKILVDALFGDQDYGFCDIPSKGIINTMLKNEGVYRNADLIAVTHAHVDHFYSPFVLEHMLSNKKCKFISCQQTVDNLKKQDKSSNIINQLIEITPDNLCYADTTVNGIGVRVYRISHGPYFTDDPNTGEKINRHKNVQNLGFIFNIDGVKIFHSGDSDEEQLAEFEHFGLDKEKIDIAILGNGFIWQMDCKGIELVKNFIKPKHIVLSHIHHSEFDKYNELADKLKNIFSDIKVFKEESETKSYIFER